MKNRRLIGVLGLLFGLSAGAVVLYCWSPIIETAIAWHETRDWVPVRAKVLQAELYGQPGEQNHADSLSVTTRYVYDYQGREFQAERVGLLVGRPNTLDDWPKQWHAKLRAARDYEYLVDAWIDPDHPERAILDREVRWQALTLIALVSLAFMAMSALGWFGLWYAIRNAPSEPEILPRSLGKRASIADIEHAGVNEEKPAQARTQSYPWAVRNARHIIPVVFVAIFALMAGPMLLDFYKAFQGDENQQASASDKTNSENASRNVSPSSASNIAATPEKWFSAANSHRLADLKAIAAQGFDINTQSEKGTSALAAAANYGYLDVVAWLVDAGAEIDQKNGDRNGNNYLTTPLMRAGYGGNPKVVALLLEKGANIHAQDQFNRTPLHFMSWGGCGECIRMLASKGANLEARATGNYDETPLMIGAGMGKVESVRTLLDLGADAQAKDKFGSTALGWAQTYNRPEVIKLLER